MLSEEEYKLIYKQIKFIAEEVHQEIASNDSWINYIKDQAYICENIELQNNHELFFLAEISFLSAMFGYELELANEIIKHFYITENNKIINGQEKQFISQVFRI